MTYRSVAEHALTVYYDGNRDLVGKLLDRLLAEAHECDTPEYTEGPCHCAKHDPQTALKERENGRVPAVATDTTPAIADADQREIAELRDTIKRVESTLTVWEGTSDAGALSAAISEALRGA